MYILLSRKFLDRSNSLHSGCFLPPSQTSAQHWLPMKDRETSCCHFGVALGARPSAWKTHLSEFEREPGAQEERVTNGQGQDDRSNHRRNCRRSRGDQTHATMAKPNLKESVLSAESVADSPIFADEAQLARKHQPSAQMRHNLIKNNPHHTLGCERSDTTTCPVVASLTCSLASK